MTTKGTDNRFRSLTVVGEPGTPATPASGDFKLYVADDGTFYVMDDTGTPTALGGGGLSDPMTTRGDIIVRNASNVTARLAIGSAGKVLSSDGTDVSWQTPAAGGGLVFLESHTASASATLDFTTFISSSYVAYKFVVESLIMATNHVNLWLLMGTGGGPTYDTGTNYSYDQLVWRAGGSGGAGGTGQTKIVLDYSNSDSIENGTAALAGVQGELMLYDPQNTSLYKQIAGRVHYLDAAGFRVTNEMRGAYESTTAVTAIRFMASSGNITSGTIRVYGLAKS